MLSHPLIVEAIETCFVPIAVRNNSEGDADARVREAFEEPAWNNPVVRILDGKRRDLVPRIGNEWSRAQLVAAMVAALTAAELEVPPFLALLHEELDAHRRGVDLAIFGMG